MSSKTFAMPRFMRGFTTSDAISTAALLAIVIAMMLSAAIAGTDTTFDATTTKLSDWTSGSLGKMAAMASVAAALVGMVLRFDWRLIAGAVGLGLTAATGPQIVGALTSAIF